MQVFIVVWFILLWIVMAVFLWVFIKESQMADKGFPETRRKKWK